jgi:UDP-glucose:(heptosyl)LPS alpha-1,3-glucosyltransferase
MKKTLKIAVLVKRFISSGGAERYALEVSRRLLKKGHEVTLYARQVEPGQETGVRWIPVSDRWRFSSVLSSVSFAVSTARLLSQESYDVVHSHERGFAQDILTVHTFSYRGNTEKYSLLKRIDRVYLSPRSALYLWLEGKQMRTSRLVAVSDVILDDIRRNYTSAEKVSVIPPGVDTDWFHPSVVLQKREEERARQEIPANETVILFVGSEFKRKGLDTVIPLISPGSRLVVVGKGERLGSYESLARRSGTLERVHFKGHSDDIRRYYAASDVVVLPSRSEAFGMSVLEGMACGLPVVTSANTGVASLIHDGRDGFVFRGVEELSKLLERLSDPELRTRIGIEARNKAERYSWNRTAEQYEELYYRVAEQRKGDRPGR